MSTWKKRLRALWRWLIRHSAILILILAALTIIFTLIGVGLSRSLDTRMGHSGPWAVRFFDWLTTCIYQAARALVVDMGPQDGTFNISIGLARLSAVALFALVAIKAIGQLFSKSFDDLFIRFTRREISLVVGLGRLGNAVALQEAAENKFVIAIDKDPDCPNRQNASECGVVFVSRDVTEESALREFVFRQPTKIVLVSGDDLTNINALANIRNLRLEYRKNKKLAPANTECYVHIENPNLFHSFSRCLVESGVRAGEGVSTTGLSSHSASSRSALHTGLKAHVFNIDHETACQLIIDELTPLRPRKTDEVALYVVFGFERMGIAMVKELVEFAHFENDKRSRILVLSSDPEMDYQRCIARWPRMMPRDVHDRLGDVRFDPNRDPWTSQVASPEIDASPKDSRAVQYAANVQFSRISSPDAISSKDVQHLVSLATEPDVRPVFLFCHDDDNTNFRLASDFEDMLQDFHGINRELPPNPKLDKFDRKTPLHFPVFAFLPRSRPLREALHSAKNRNPMSVRSFGNVQQGLQRAQDPTVEDVALDISYGFDNPDWDVSQPRPIEYASEIRRRPYWEYLSNLNAAEHKRVSIQLVGLKMETDASEKGSSPFDFERLSESEKTMLAQVEHNRWMAERLLMGWELGERHDQPPRRPSICATKYLPKKEIEKDKAQIRTVFGYFNKRNVFFRRIAMAGFPAESE